MKFADLLPDMTVRIPNVPDSLFPGRDEIAPAVGILTAPTPCPACPALTVTAFDADTGQPHRYHRLPERAVIHITPAPSTETSV